MFHRIIFLLLTVSSLSCNFTLCAVCFQSFSEHRLLPCERRLRFHCTTAADTAKNLASARREIACRSTQNAARIKRFRRLHSDKTIKQKTNKINSLLYWRVTLLMFIQPLHSSQPAGRTGDFGIFFNGLAKRPRVLRSSWILCGCPRKSYLASEAVSLLFTRKRETTWIVRSFLYLQIIFNSSVLQITT